MTKGHKTYSVVIPVYNAAQFLEKTIDIIISFIEEGGVNICEVILVDDASKDQSWLLIQELCKKYSILKGLKLGRNFGQHNATCAGISKAGGDYIITMDDDLEFDIQHLNEMIDLMTNNRFKIVYGEFNQNKGSFPKQFVRSIYSSGSKLILGDDQVKGSSLRILERDLAHKVAKDATHFVFIDEALRWQTDSIGFVSVKRRKGLRSISSYSFYQLLSLGFSVTLYSSMYPLKLLKRLGILISSIMFLLGIYFIIKYLFKGVGVEGFTALIVTITFSTGFIMYALGTIGEFIGKVFKNLNNAPAYSIEEEI